MRRALNRIELPLRHLLNRLEFALSSAWQNFWRNAAVSLASVLIVWVVLLALAVLLLVLHSLDQILAVEKSRASALSIFLADNTPLSAVMDFKLHLEQDPRVTGVTYLTKDQAMQRALDNQLLPADVLGSLGPNPLPASLDVTVRDIRDLGDLERMVRNSPLVDKSPSTNFDQDIIGKIILLSRVAGLAGLVLVVSLTALSVFIIMLTIRTAIYLRRKEIEVMKLVGATDWFVRWPFLLEGIITGTVGAALAAIIVAVGYRPAVFNLKSVLFFVPLFYDPAYLRFVLGAMLAFGLLLGSFGSYLSIRRFLHQ